jgi:hypothetical protein
MTVVNSFLALSTLAALIISSGVTPVTALSISPAPHVSRHLSLAHQAKVKRNAHKKRCKARPPPQADPQPGNGGYNNGNNGNGGNGGYGGDGGYGGGYNGPVSTSKKGAAWPNGPSDLDKWRGISWIYTWSPDCPENCPSLGIECVPMLWGWQHLDNFIAKTNQPGYARTALGPNEPDLFGNGDLSSGISPESAADLWWRGMQPLKAKGYRLGAPATTSAPAGKDWMHNFLNACQGCTIDFFPIHWYDVGIEKFKAYVTDWHNTFNANIWVTEYACQNFNGGAQCSSGEVWDFLQQTVAWMESQPWIEKYAYFGTMHDMVNVNYDNQLMGGDGSPNSLGWTYLSIA